MYFFILGCLSHETKPLVSVVMPVFARLIDVNRQELLSSAHTHRTRCRKNQPKKSFSNTQSGKRENAPHTAASRISQAEMQR